MFGHETLRRGVKRINVDALADLQRKLESNIRHAEITSGSRVPIDLVKGLASGLTPDMLVYNLGCGDGRKAVEQAIAVRSQGLSVVGMDISNSGLQNGRMIAQALGVANIEFVYADVSQHEWVRPNSAGLILAEALLCNMIGTDAEVAIGGMAGTLMTGGYVCVADCLTAHDDGVEQAMINSGYPVEYIKKWRALWFERYYNNALAMDLGDVAYTFIVMPPGEEKQSLEMASANILRELLVSGKIERLARHWRKNELVNLFARGGIKLLSWQNTVWKSRAGEPIAGMVAVFQKQDVRDFEVESLAIPAMTTVLGFDS